MRTSIQTVCLPAIGWRARCGLVAVLGAFVLGAPGLARAQTGQIACKVTENGSPTRGSFVVEQGGRRVASASCGRTVSVPAGPSKVTVRPDGVLDNPARTLDTTVADGQTATVSVNFETAGIEVRIETSTRGATGLVVVQKEGRRIGTLGSGVEARLSAGSYEILVRLAGEERRYSVDLRPGQTRLIRAQF